MSEMQEENMKPEEIRQEEGRKQPNKDNKNAGQETRDIDNMRWQ
jgi:hypothetical protein